MDQLYDLEADPYEIHNLADDAQYREVVEEHRAYLLEWMLETEDTIGNR